MNEQLTANEQAYDVGYDDSMKGYDKISYEGWCAEDRLGSHSAYKAGYEDAERDNESDYFEDEQ